MRGGHCLRCHRSLCPAVCLCLCLCLMLEENYAPVKICRLANLCIYLCMACFSIYADCVQTPWNIINALWCAACCDVWVRFISICLLLWLHCLYRRTCCSASFLSECRHAWHGVCTNNACPSLYVCVVYIAGAVCASGWYITSYHYQQSHSAKFWLHSLRLCRSFCAKLSSAQLR